MKKLALLCCVGALLVGSQAQADGPKTGTPDIQSAGPLAFGPQGILLVADPKGAAIFAIETGDSSGDASKAQINVENLTAKVAAALQVQSATIVDLAVNPLSGNVYLSVQSGGPDAAPAIVKVDGEGKVAAFPLKEVRYSKAILKDAPKDEVVGEGRRRGNMRLQSITDLTFMDGQVLVSGLSAADAPSTIRALSFPFSEADPGTSLEIFHAAHGRSEDYAVPNAFVPFNIDGEPTVLAAFTCTPLVKFPVKALEPGKKVKGTTIAELGNQNRPLDMIIYKKDGKDYVLMANNARGVMKISTEDIARSKGLEEPVRGGQTAGQSYETIKDWTGIAQLAKLNDTHAVVLKVREPAERIDPNVSTAADLLTVELP